MKIKIIQSILLFTILIFNCCTSQSHKNRKEIEISKKCDSNLKQTNIEIDKDSTVSLGQLYTNVLVFRNLKHKKYFIENSSGKVLLKNLNYFGRIGGGFQALTNENEIVFYDLKLKKLNQAPKQEVFGTCGNVSFWKVKIDEKEDYYIVQKIEGHSGSYGRGKWQHIDSILKLDSKDIYFLDKTKSIEFNENFYYPETIIIAYKNSYGIRKDNKTFIFDSIDISDTAHIKVICNGLFGYFEITEIKYKQLGAYNYNLAPFELDNGKTGYIDVLGNEYYQ